MENQNQELYKYVKVQGHPNWFLMLEPNQKEPANLSEIMQEKMLGSQINNYLNNPEPLKTKDEFQRIQLVATRQIDYEALAIKCDTILIRPSGSFMPLHGSQIIEEIEGTHFPVDEYGEIVICENDKKPEYEWVNYLKNRFPNKKIVTINYFNLRTEQEVSAFFEKAEYVTFSTTFTDYDWYKKLIRNLKPNNTVVGHCHISENWEGALNLYSEVQMIFSNQMTHHPLI